MDGKLEHLAALLRQRASLDGQIADLIGRPAHRGHVGEFIASHVFGIDLNQSGSAKGHDGAFCAGPLQGRTVNVKFYSSWDGALDIHVGDGAPHYYLVLVGGGPRSWGIAHVFLFGHDELVRHGVRPGIAAGVRKELTEAARLYPKTNPAVAPPLTEEQIAILRLYS